MTYLPTPIQLAMPSDDYTVAVISYPDGVYDEAGGWETVQNIAQTEPYAHIDVYTGDAHLSREDIEAMVAYERRIYADCFADEGVLE